MKTYLIVATDENNGIGKNGQMPWHFKSEMKYFSRTTKGSAVIMGRKTWESLPENYRPLPERENIVITSQADYQAPGAKVANSLTEALTPASAKYEKAFIIGGGNVYKQAMQLPNLAGIYQTKISQTYDCDTFFPPVPNQFQEQLIKEEEENGTKLRYYLYS